MRRQALGFFALRALLTLLALLTITGCMSLAPVSNAKESVLLKELPKELPPQQGRMSLVIKTDPPQSLSAQWVLRGHPQAGELTLSGFLGTTLGIIRWSERGAEWQSPQTTYHYASLTELTQTWLHEDIPLHHLWMAWQNPNEAIDIPGWQLDHTRQDQGIFHAIRLAEPTIDLRLLLDITP